MRHLGRLYLIDMATREYISSNMPASAHAVLRDHYAFWNFWLTLGALVPTAALLGLVLVTDDFAQRAFHVSPDALKLINASVALFAFVCVLVQLVWKPDSREAAHAHAVGYFAKTRLEAGSFLDERDALNVRGLPPIRHATFVRLKQLHLQATYLSRRLEIDPWLSLPKRGCPPRGYVVPEAFAPDVLNLPRIGRRPNLGLATPARRVQRIRRRISRARDAPRAHQFSSVSSSAARTKASQCNGLIERKSRWSIARRRLQPRRSAVAMTAASAKPRSRSRYCDSRSRIRTRSECWIGSRVNAPAITSSKNAS